MGVGRDTSCPEHNKRTRPASSQVRNPQSLSLQSHAFQSFMHMSDSNILSQRVEEAKGGKQGGEEVEREIIEVRIIQPGFINIDQAVELLMTPAYVELPPPLTLPSRT